MRPLVDMWRALERRILPPHCLLCGGAGQRALDLCAQCQRDVPRNTRFCARCAAPLPTPVELCGACQKREPAWDSAWAPFCYGWPLDSLEQRFKFSASLACGRVLAHIWGERAPPRPLPALIVPVPLHAARLRSRGYNQALELARPLARRLRVSLAPRLLQRVRATDAQTELHAAARRRNVRGAFVVDPHAELPDHIAVLDDVMTTGATLGECARVLKAAGAVRVDVWALARAPTPHSEDR